jgi:hypothetical protein
VATYNDFERRFAQFLAGAKDALGNDAPVSRSVQRTGNISLRPILGGLHYQYARV